MFAIKRMPSTRQAELDELIETAQGKIGLGLVHSRDRTELSSAELRFATTAMLMYANAAIRFAFGPNHACCGEFDVPRGFQFNVSLDAPLYATPFPERSMYNGVMAFPLDKGTWCHLTSKRKPIPPGYFSIAAVRQSIQSRLSEAEHLGDDDTNYAGIFSTTVREGFENRVQYWAVVQCHSTAVSEQFYNYLCEQEASHGDVARGATRYTTWRSFFLKDQRVAEFVEQQRRHRAKVLCTLVRACGLGPIAETTSETDNVQFLLDSPDTIHVSFNSIERIEAHDDSRLAGDALAYLSDMVSYKTIASSGTVLREPARLGLAILRGPWTRPKHPLDTGFPCSTGHRTAVRALRLAELSAADRAAMRPNETHFWEHADDRPLNLNLATVEANRRDDRRWRKIESLLGYDKAHGLVDLRPVQVKLHSTAQPIENESDR